MLKNRLEQFKKRQRDEAAKQQRALGEKMAAEGETGGFGGDMHAEGAEGNESEEDGEEEDDVVEAYHRDMSPEPVLAKDLGLADRRLQISSEADFRRALVSLKSFDSGI